MEASDRALRWESLLNARDLGGIPGAHGQVTRGAIVRSDALYRLNDAGRAALVAHGVRTVIDMRAEREVSANGYDFDAASGVTRHHIPQQSEEMWAKVRGRARVDFDLTMLELARSRFATIAQVIADAPPGGVLIHCEVGKDRTGPYDDAATRSGRHTRRRYRRGLRAHRDGSGVAVRGSHREGRERRTARSVAGGSPVPCRGHGGHPRGVPRTPWGRGDVSPRKRSAACRDRRDPRSDAGSVVGDTVASWFWRMRLRNYTGASA